MTNFEAIVGQGPKFLAQLMVDCKIKAMEKICERFGVPFDISEKMRAEMLIEHHAFLLREVDLPKYTSSPNC